MSQSKTCTCTRKTRCAEHTTVGKSTAEALGRIDGRAYAERVAVEGQAPGSTTGSGRWW